MAWWEVDTLGGGGLKRTVSPKRWGSTGRTIIECQVVCRAGISVKDPICLVISNQLDDKAVIFHINDPLALDIH